jgi:hypothetical protein
MGGRRWVAWASLAVGYVAFLWLGDLLDREPAPTLAQVVGLAAWLLALATTTEVIRVRRERAAELGRARQEEARRRRALAEQTTVRRGAVPANTAETEQRAVRVRSRGRVEHAD